MHVGYSKCTWARLTSWKAFGGGKRADAWPIHPCLALVLRHKAGVQAHLLRLVSALLGREVGREIHLVAWWGGFIVAESCSGSIRLWLARE